MSRTYRGKDRERFKRVGHTIGKNPKAKREEMYKNASRTFCVSYGATKWLFGTESAAKAAIGYNKKIAKSRGREEKYERAYYCHKCGGWHLTTISSKDFYERMEKIMNRRRTINDNEHPSPFDEKKH